jgi:hypothetical protein
MSLQITFETNLRLLPLCLPVEPTEMALGSTTTKEVVHSSQTSTESVKPIIVILFYFSGLWC